MPRGGWGWTTAKDRARRGSGIPEGEEGQGEGREGAHGSAPGGRACNHRWGEGCHTQQRRSGTMGRGDGSVVVKVWPGMGGS